MMLHSLLIHYNKVFAGFPLECESVCIGSFEIHDYAIA